MKWAEEFINAEASSIYELDEESGEIFVRLARGKKKDPVKDIRLKLGDGIAGSVVETGQPMVVQDVSKEKRFSYKFDKLTGFKTKSLICVPLTLRDKSIGAIQVLNKKDQEPFSKTDLEILTSMSQQIAVAMENARLYRRLQERFELTANELRSAQGRLIRSERLAAMGHLVNGVAHEIRNPITTIGGFAKRIKNLVGEDNRLKRYTDIIMNETARLERLVRQVNDLSKIQSAQLSPGNMISVIDEVLNWFKPLAAGQSVNVVRHIEKDLPMITMDSPQLVTALSNILENALESMSADGKIELDVHRDNNSIMIVVKDSGSGIAQMELDSIYDPFVTSKTSGAGLGLTMVYQIVSNHHGEINIRSKASEGTRVSIRLPINPSKLQNFQDT
ncbi:MAG: GAF domain-containing protein [Deltaproteobacteria bacterium]|nr:GAF domain-containing protein [Deltaproteobacteria bacterium]